MTLKPQLFEPDNISLSMYALPPTCVWRHTVAKKQRNVRMFVINGHPLSLCRSGVDTHRSHRQLCKLCQIHPPLSHRLRIKSSCGIHQDPSCLLTRPSPHVNMIWLLQHVSTWPHDSITNMVSLLHVSAWPQDPSASYDFVWNDRDPTPDENEEEPNSHGTSCAGEIAMSRDCSCGVGVAYGCSIGGLHLMNWELFTFFTQTYVVCKTGFGEGRSKLCVLMGMHYDGVTMHYGHCVSARSEGWLQLHHWLDGG